MPRAYRQLALDERRTIFRLLNAKVPVAAITQQLGRHRSAIHREISRNHFREQREYAGYYPPHGARLRPAAPPTVEQAAPA